MNLEFKLDKFPWDVCSELFSEFLRSVNGSKGLLSKAGDLSMVPGTQVWKKRNGCTKLSSELLMCT